MGWIEEEIERLKLQNLYRVRLQREGLLDFCSNDYLGLRDHPEVVEASIRVLRDYGLGSGASQLVSGYTKHHRALEEKLAEFKGVPCCVLFGSGYLANLGAISALVGDKDILLSDELNHASIIDACRLSKAKVLVFRHRDYNHLEQLLRKERKNYRRCLVVSDTVFSMDGDIADVRLLKELSKVYDCMLYLDEAHATGVIGERGRGGLELFSEGWEEYIILMGTLSKALGSYGAFVCGSELLCEFLVNKARSLIFSTSLPPSVCAGAKRAIELIEEHSELPQRLRALSSHISKSLSALGFEVPFHGTPIMPIMVYEEAKALAIRDHLLRKGLLVQAIRYPTVPLGKARLRLTASLRYKGEEFELLFEAFREVSPLPPL